MSTSTRLIYSLAFVIAAAGFFLPFWPLIVLGVVVAALSGRWIFAMLMALLIDVALGPPHGVLHMLYVPFTLLALLCALAHYFLSGYFLDRGSPDRL